MPPGIGIVRSLAFTKVATYCSQYMAVYNKLVELDDVPDTVQAYQQNLMVRTIASYVGWADWADVFYLLAQQYNDGGGALINLINPGTHDATLVNNPTFTSLEGFTGGGASVYINTNYNPATQAINYFKDSCGINIYIRNNVDENCRDFGSKNIDYITAEIRDGNVITYWINTTNSSGVAGITDSRGLWCFQRENDAANQKVYRNDTLIRTEADASTNIPDANIFILCYNNAGIPQAFSTKQVSAFTIGNYLNASQRTISQSAIETLMDYNGKGVIP